MGNCAGSESVRPDNQKGRYDFGSENSRSNSLSRSESQDEIYINEDDANVTANSSQNSENRDMKNK